ncbi:MAG: glutathione peroxidase [Candidatus Scalindua sp. AMX11]|nr:MAG: glutathione peroxidase [Candidatus Scalindua sp.]NOG84917.1 glutathione peroxidase [Planctomycetota bacterium]RZV85013.1 MAG: glutathione peroxidase [Candidatus Scalindua sp. SCAELEC01]TDE65099.1 MAG: glutathione peroxidase [Candidatus Scalindua sp. AMX11]
MFFLTTLFLGDISLAQNSEDSQFYDIEVESIEGEKYHLSEYRGKAVLIVNTASECGYTPQYKSLQSLYEQYKEKGLVVLGVPCNQFGKQEPGTEDQIKKFCELNYDVNFPLLRKADVKGPKQHPLYRYLLEESGSTKEIAWNFEKFLVGRDGQIKKRFVSSIKPLSKVVVSAVKKALEN